MIPKKQFDVEIDKLTRSVEDAVSGDCFKTAVLELTSADVGMIQKHDWNFDWQSEAKMGDRKVFKLVLTTHNPSLIQGLVSLQDRGDHIFMQLIESSKLNRGSTKKYLGVPGNLVAFACKNSFDRGYEGYVSFESKTQLIQHYQKTLKAHVLFGNIMAIDALAANDLVEQYFPKNL